MAATSIPVADAALGTLGSTPSIAGSQASGASGGAGIFGSSNQLSLANGMTAGLGAGGGPYSNPPLPGASSSGAPVNPYGGDPNWPIKRVGVMRNLPGSLLNGINDVSYLYFIYNPNQIAASFSTNVNQIPPLYLYGSDSQSSLSTINSGSNAAYGINGSSSTIPNLANSQTVSWSLIFDRTYDMMYDTNPGENRGVLKDVAALYALMGTFESSGAVPVSTPVQVVFGQTSSGQVWGFTGYISSVNIIYGIFRNNMIPSRCEVDLTMTCTYVAQSVPAGGTVLTTIAGLSAAGVQGPPGSGGAASLPHAA